jgi:hypothetical protein
MLEVIWKIKPSEITEENFHKYSLSVFNNENLVIHISCGQCSLDEMRDYFRGNIERALSTTLNNIAIRGREAERLLNELNLEVWD